MNQIHMNIGISLQINRSITNVQKKINIYILELVIILTDFVYHAAQMLIHLALRTKKRSICNAYNKKKQK